MAEISDPRVAFVTGASSGIGRGLALRLAADGYAVGVAARRVHRLDEVVEAIRGGGGRAVACPCDVTDRAEVGRAVARTVSELGPVDLLVANAGVSGTTDVRAFQAGGVEWVLRVNFLGAVYAVEAVLADMLDRNRGHLVAVGSLAGYNGIPRSAAYSASKAALHNFFESLRLDLRETGVDVTILTPGYIETELTARNDHPMPLLVDLDDALDRMMPAIRRRRALLAFPRPLSTLARVGQILPTWLFDALASRIPREKKKESAEPGPDGS